jgi:hypothetical protein
VAVETQARGWAILSTYAVQWTPTAVAAAARPRRREAPDAHALQGLRFEAFGRDRVELQLGGRRLLLSQRHSEILVLLTEHPEGLTAEQLAVALYGDLAKPVTARAEISRLRKVLGSPSAVGGEPYRLLEPFESDVAAVRRLLLSGRVRGAAALHRDLLLPSSEAPGVVELRDELVAWTRNAVMTSDDVDALWTWATTPPGAGDLPLWVRFLSNVPYGDGRRAFAAARVAGLRRLYAVAA